MKHSTQIYRSDWNGIQLEITYDPQWLPLGDDLAHLEVRSICPLDAPLPITETGYRSHFIATSAIAAAGGPVAYVDVWLEADSHTLAWRERDQAARQPSLF